MTGIDTKFTVDLTDFISDEKIVKLAEKILEDRITKRIDEIIATRTRYGIGDVVDQILVKVAERYVNDLSSNEIREKLSNRCKDIIDNKCKDIDDIITFNDHLSYELKDIISKYVNEHSLELQNIMKGRIEDKLIDIVNDNIADIIAKRINMKKVIKEILQD